MIDQPSLFEPSSEVTMRVAAQALANDKKRRESFVQTHTRSTDPASSERAAAKVAATAIQWADHIASMIEHQPRSLPWMKEWAETRGCGRDSLRQRISDARALLREQGKDLVLGKDSVYRVVSQEQQTQ